MDSAVDAVGASHQVEANQLDIVAGVPRISVRFTVEPSTDEEENGHARATAADMQDAVERVATTARLTVLRRNRGRWGPL